MECRVEYTVIPYEYNVVIVLTSDRTVFILFIIFLYNPCAFVGSFIVANELKSFSISRIAF